MPELPKGFELEKKSYTCAVCKMKVDNWYCEACDEFALDCGCRDHSGKESHREIMEARRRSF